jgi:hypothetical protein
MYFCYSAFNSQYNLKILKHLGSYHVATFLDFYLSHQACDLNFQITVAPFKPPPLLCVVSWTTALYNRPTVHIFLSHGCGNIYWLDLWNFRIFRYFKNVVAVQIRYWLKYYWSGAFQICNPHIHICYSSGSKPIVLEIQSPIWGPKRQSGERCAGSDLKKPSCANFLSRIYGHNLEPSSPTVPPPRI